MRRVLVLLFFLSLPGMSLLQMPPNPSPLPFWADPEPREIPSHALVPSLLDPQPSVVVWGIEAAPFSDTSLAAILSNTVPLV